MNRWAMFLAFMGSASPQAPLPMPLPGLAAEVGAYGGWKQAPAPKTTAAPARPKTTNRRQSDSLKQASTATPSYHPGKTAQ